MWLRNVLPMIIQAGRGVPAVRQTCPQQAKKRSDFICSNQQWL